MWCLSRQLVSYLKYNFEKLSFSLFFMQLSLKHKIYIKMKNSSLFARYIYEK